MLGVVPAQRVLLERDESTGVARITLNNPERQNTYDPENGYRDAYRKIWAAK